MTAEGTLTAQVTAYHVHLLPTETRNGQASLQELRHRRGTASYPCLALPERGADAP